MNILESLVQLRDDIKEWVTVNINLLNNKIDSKSIPIDSSIDLNSSNPVQNKTIALEFDKVSSNFSSKLQEKVNKVNGKGLSSNDYTDEDKAEVLSFASKLQEKVDKADGKGLSSNDYTDEDKAKLSLIGDDIVSASLDNELSLSSDNPVKNKAITHAFTRHEENTEMHHPSISELTSEELIVTDAEGNIIIRINSNGIGTTDLKLKDKEIQTIIQEKIDAKVPVFFENYKATLINEIINQLPIYQGEAGEY